jgi:hypothetical protein
MKVKVYYNLKRKIFSIVACEGEHRNHVIGYAKEVFLEDCTFKVSAKGRARVLESRQKNVHAYVYGTLCTKQESLSKDDLGLLTLVRYNPYETESFVTLTGKPVVSSPQVFLTCRHGSPKIYSIES